MLQRAVLVLDADRRLAHVEYVDGQIQEPDYQAAVDAVRLGPPDWLLALPALPYNHRTAARPVSPLRPNYRG